MSHSDVSVYGLQTFEKQLHVFVVFDCKRQFQIHLFSSHLTSYFLSIYFFQRNRYTFSTCRRAIASHKKIEMNREGVSLGFHINTRIFSQMDFFYV